MDEAAAVGVGLPRVHAQADAVVVGAVIDRFPGGGEAAFPGVGLKALGHVGHGDAP